MWYVYVDRIDDGTPIYVGKGRRRRVGIKGRNSKHIRVCAKHGWNRTVVFEDSDGVKALAEEKRLISELHTYVDDPLASRLACNFTTGGEEPQVSAQSKRRSSKSALKRVEAGTHNFQDVEWRRNLSSETQHKLAAEGRHNFQDRKKASERSKRTTRELWEQGKHPFQDPEWRKRVFDNPQAKANRSRQAKERAQALWARRRQAAGLPPKPGDERWLVPKEPTLSSEPT